MGHAPGEPVPAQEVKPAWSVILFTTLAGAGQGLFLALAALELFGAAPRELIVAGAATSFALLVAGLAASFFHLGRPGRAWRTAAMWRTSWLSREVIVLPALLACVLAWGGAWYLEFSSPTSAVLAVIGIGLALALFVCTAMIYACLPFLQEWHTPLTVVNYTAFGCASALTLGAVLAAFLAPELARGFAIAALVTGLVAWLVRLASLVRNARLRPKSTTASAIGVAGPSVRQISQGAMGGSYNTREFFHGRTRQAVRAVRWAFIALVFPLPAALLVLFPASPNMLAAAFVLQYAGLLAERWYFFAEARHPQNLYYQAIA
jgi:sulfite dehydrogenase (quinone) subunit SoeC